MSLGPRTTHLGENSAEMQRKSMKLAILIAHAILSDASREHLDFAQQPYRNGGSLCDGEKLSRADDGSKSVEIDPSSKLCDTRQTNDGRNFATLTAPQTEVDCETARPKKCSIKRVVRELTSFAEVWLLPSIRAASETGQSARR